VPLRFFVAASLFHLAAWVVLLLTAPAWPGWRGGLGWPLAALHLVTLGTLVCAAIGASLQLLPVATRQPVRWPRLPGLLAWVYVPGVVVLVAGMGLSRPGWLAAGAALVIGALLPFALLLALNLRAARGMAGVVLHGWGAQAALALLLASAAALVALWLGHPVLGRDAARGLHRWPAPSVSWACWRSACRTCCCRCSRWAACPTTAASCGPAPQRCWRWPWPPPRRWPTPPARRCAWRRCWPAGWRWCCTCA
jgi:hypothetical protein